MSDGKIFYETDGKYQGYFGIAFQMAFYELLHGKSFDQSLINVIEQGGDTDTNGCIVGALIGALYGIKNIPIQWTITVGKKNKRSLYYQEINQENIKEIAIALAQLSY